MNPITKINIEPLEELLFLRIEDGYEYSIIEIVTKALAQDEKCQEALKLFIESCECILNGQEFKSWPKEVIDVIREKGSAIRETFDTLKATSLPGEAMLRMALQFRKPVGMLVLAERLGSKNASRYLGKHYLHSSLDKAEFYFHKAIALGDNKAYVDLGALLVRKRKYEEAKAIFEEGYAKGEYRCKLLELSFGLTGDESIIDEALAHHEIKAYSDYAIATKYHPERHSMKKALKLLNEGVQIGDMDSAYQLAELYTFGYDKPHADLKIEVDWNTAFYYAMLASKTNNKAVITLCYIRYFLGDDVNEIKKVLEEIKANNAEEDIILSANKLMEKIDAGDKSIAKGLTKEE